ncbi:glycosyltransferase family 4 protein [Glycomyces sp. YM15]|uniref:glycosyltransferase family 4 protein n=1 Tax=Glycomyces sp. YM15 TaxID=2800446 RepID=UPI0019643AA5|nr:glycosyltransferase family 4 protein [Glycomyces sp. YM15]
MNSRYDACVVLNYYAPYTSGLTRVAMDVAEFLAANGKRVAVVASRHDPALPRFEVREGVHVHRARVAARIGRGVVSPEFASLAGRIARRADVVNIHVPMLEAGLIARAARGTPVVVHHHDDVWLSQGVTARAQIAVVDASVGAALRRATAVVVANLDHAKSSRHWSIMEQRRVCAVPPPCRERGPGKPAFRDGAGPHIGFLGRMAPEKGLHHLVRAFRDWEDPAARLLLAGDESVAGGDVVARLRAQAAGDDRVRFLGRLEEAAIADFHASLDAFALPSVAEESFGITQTEAMMSGVPVVASDLPGMRVPLQTTGFGELVESGDADGLREALRRVCRYPARRRSAGAAIATAAFGMRSSLEAYAAVLEEAAAGT